MKYLTSFDSLVLMKIKTQGENVERTRSFLSLIVHLKGFPPDGDSNDVDIEPEGLGGLDIHANAHVIAQFKANEVLVGLTPKE